MIINAKELKINDTILINGVITMGLGTDINMDYRVVERWKLIRITDVDKNPNDGEIESFVGHFNKLWEFEKGKWGRDGLWEKLKIHRNDQLIKLKK